MPHAQISTLTKQKLALLSWGLRIGEVVINAVFDSIFFVFAHICRFAGAVKKMFTSGS